MTAQFTELILNARVSEHLGQVIKGITLMSNAT